MATDSVGAAGGMTGEAMGPITGPLDGWVGVLRSPTVRRVLAAMACIAAFGWLVAVAGAGVIVMNNSSSQRVEATKLSEPAPAPAALAVAQAPVAVIPEAVASAPSVVSPPSAVSLPPAPVVAPAPSERAPSIVPAQPSASRTATVSESGLRLRDLPTTQGRVLDTLVGGVIVSVLDAPVEREGLQWVPVRVAGDKLGWVATDGLE